MSGFHEVRFPDNIAYGATGGPEFATTVVATGAGHEKRNVNWAEARRPLAFMGAEIAFSSAADKATQLPHRSPGCDRPPGCDLPDCTRGSFCV
jgi:hypothetical protein